MSSPRPTPTALPNQLTPVELLRALFEAQTPVEQLGMLPDLVEQWLAASKPFTRFVQFYQSKIRKKIKICRNVEEAYNLACELYTAYLLLQEAKFAVAYEPLTKAQGRSADFAVTFSTHTLFHVEVTRLRGNMPEVTMPDVAVSEVTVSEATEGALAASTLDEQRTLLRRYASRRLADVVCEKLGQFSPATPNVLCVWSEAHLIQELDIAEAMHALKVRVEQRDPAVFARYGLAKPADFIRPYQALSAILVNSQPHSSQLEPVQRPVWRWWQNRESRHPLPAKVAHLIQGRLAGEST